MCILQEREELQRQGAALHRRLQGASAEVEGLEAALRDASLSNNRLRSRLQQENGALGALKEKKAEKESALFLRNHITFTQQQQITAVREAIAVQQRNLQEKKQLHQGVIEKLQVS